MTGPLRRDLERGRSLTTAAGDFGSGRPEPSAAVRGSARGCSSGTVTDRVGSHVALACSVIAVVAEVGGSEAGPIDRTAATLRLRTADLQERAAQSAQARLSAHVLTVVPLAVLVLLAATDADVRHTLAAPVGFLCLTLGLLLNLGGWWWMRRIIGNGSIA